MVSPIWVAAAVLVSVALFLLIWLWSNRSLSPEERERRRRLRVNALGRISDGLITDVDIIPKASGGASHVLRFNYTLNGVTYSAAQDITTLLDYLGRSPERVGGPTSIKYLPANPSDSIVICEKWSGLR